MQTDTRNLLELHERHDILDRVYSNQGKIDYPHKHPKPDGDRPYEEDRQHGTLLRRRGGLHSDPLVSRGFNPVTQPAKFSSFGRDVRAGIVGGEGRFSGLFSSIGLVTMLFLLSLLSSIAQLAMFPLHSFSSIGLFPYRLLSFQNGLVYLFRSLWDNINYFTTDLETRSRV